MLKLLNKLMNILSFRVCGHVLLHFTLFAWHQVRADDFNQLPLRFNDDFIRQLQSIVMIKKVSQDKSADEEEVLIIEEHVAACQFSIAASTPDFLHVVFNALWHVVVDDRLNV